MSPSPEKQSIEAFLADVEGRAFQMARIATGCDQEALDIMQDVMFSLVKSYKDKPASQWKPLFFRMLQNRITDFHRRKTLTGKIFSWMGIAKDDAEEELNAVDYLEDPNGLSPELLHRHERFSDALIEALQQLPQRQQQTFLLRVWEGLSVQETAEAMNCSAGSIKTHLSRALTTLRQHLEPHYFSGTEHEQR